MWSYEKYCTQFLTGIYFAYNDYGHQSSLQAISTRQSLLSQNIARLGLDSLQCDARAGKAAMFPAPSLSAACHWNPSIVAPAVHAIPKGLLACATSHPPEAARLCRMPRAPCPRSLLEKGRAKEEFVSQQYSYYSSVRRLNTVRARVPRLRES